MKTPLSLLLLCALSACSTLPPAIEDPPAVDITYPQARADGKRYQGAPVRWGGVIIDIQNETTYSRVQVMAYPLNYYGRPNRDKPHQGRFYIDSREFLDPAIYAKDREITAAGTLAGEQELRIGNMPLRLPVIQSATLHLWPEYERMPYYNGGFYPFPNYYGYYGYPYFWGGYYGYYPRY